MMKDLADKKCVPCRKGGAPLPKNQILEYLARLGSEWRLNSGGHIERTYCFSDFKEALAFLSRLAEIAEREGHHPDFHLRWGRCLVEIWTYVVNGLTKNDFYLAARAEREYEVKYNILSIEGENNA
jgi:4a-hydroxytetrahydrobiopterin dehydratase